MREEIDMNALIDRQELIRDWPKSAAQANRQWEDLLVRWGDHNAVIRTTSEFGLCGLAQGVNIGRRWNPADHQWPARDHHTFFKQCWGRQTAAIVTEPYLGSDIADLVVVVRAHGLVLHTPPNPLASLWYPGWTVFCVITRRDFPDVRWLPEQAEFGEDGLDRTFADGRTFRSVLEASGLAVTGGAGD
jgi:hypothetical protein